MKINQLHVIVIIVIITTLSLLETFRIMCKLLNCCSRSFTTHHILCTDTLAHTTYTIPELASDTALTCPSLLLRCPPLHFFLMNFYISWTLDWESIMSSSSCDRVGSNQINPITIKLKQKILRKKGKEKTEQTQKHLFSHRSTGQ